MKKSLLIELTDEERDRFYHFRDLYVTTFDQKEAEEAFRQIDALLKKAKSRHRERRAIQCLCPN